MAGLEKGEYAPVTFLTLSGCDGLTDKGLGYVARYFGEGVETLSVSGCKVRPNTTPRQRFC